ncbi:hypothetical protein JG687_00015279 [Phytophthora cactorum]|uniref:Uncharacterized protein n=1 Tax=Phytophthora cactorum TaxID=29920 RepID=A0A8T1TVE2_9STRA|nr:hypothetical protein GQ600_16190 [Phytophthora cactorum]KAG6948750.1 hypothetical protein JG687_00015279 [Phytophthora cactorum]
MFFHCPGLQQPAFFRLIRGDTCRLSQLAGFRTDIATCGNKSCCTVYVHAGSRSNLSHRLIMHRQQIP